MKKAPCTTAQGDALKEMVVRIFTKRVSTQVGDHVTLCPMRCAFKKFLGDLMLDRIVNPLIPKQTGIFNCYYLSCDVFIVKVCFSGLSLQDYHSRIDMVAQRVRTFFFGEENELMFYYPASNGTDIKTIRLPTKEGNYMSVHFIIFDLFKV